MASTVRTKQGITEGFSEGGIFKCLGVPYAEPPVGERRWRPPVSVAEWAGVRKAQNFGPICPQTAGAVFKTRAKSQSEDCLYLNVWTRLLGLLPVLQVADYAVGINMPIATPRFIL